MARTVAVDFIARVSGYNGGVATSIAATKEFDGELQKLAKTHKEKFSQITTATAAAGVALAGYAVLAAKTDAVFEKTVSGVAAVSNASSKQLAALRDAAIQTGKVTVFTATSAAQAEGELEKAGVSTADVLGGALTGAVNLAAASQIDLKDAATDTAQELNIFGLAGSQASHVADVLTAAANKSATDVSGLALAMNQSGLVAHQTGLTLEQTAGTLALFAQNGLVGSDAGTSFKTMLQALQAPSQKTAGLMKELGINAYTSSGQFIGITKLAEQLRVKLGPLTQAQRDNALAQIFGSDAVRSASILYKSGGAEVQSWIDKVNDSGIAARTAKTQMNNLSGDVEQLKGSFETLAIESSGGVSKGLRDIAQGATGLLNKIVDLPTPLTSTLTVITGLAGTSLLAATGFAKAKAAGSQFLDTLRDMGESGGKAATALGKVGSFAGRLGLAGVAAFGAFEGLTALSGWIEKETGPTTRNIDALTTSLKDLAGGLGVAGELAKTFGPNLGKLPQDIAAVSDANIKLADLATKIKAIQNGKPFVGAAGELRGLGIQQNMINAPTAQQRKDLDALDQSLTGIVNSGGAAQAHIALSDLATRENLSPQEWSRLLTLLPKYQAASKDVGQANAGLAKGFGDAGANAQALAEGMDEATAKGYTFDAMWNQLNGSLLNSDQANLAANQAVENVTKTLKENAKALAKSKDGWNGNSDAALSNKIAIGQAADLAAKAADAKYEETGSVTAANQVYKDYIGNLRVVLMGLLHNKTLVDQLLSAYSKMPPLKSVPITTPGIDTAIKKAQSLHDLIYDIPKTKPVEFDLTVHGQKVLSQIGRAASVNRWGGVYQHAADGVLNQAGIYSAVSGSGARYAFAEGRTGGEAFIPKYGDYGRSMGILGTAAGWYGQMLVPALRSGLTRGGDGAYSSSHTTNVFPQQANLDPQDLDQIDRVREVRQRINRP